MEHYCTIRDNKGLQGKKAALESGTATAICVLILFLEFASLLVIQQHNEKNTEINPPSLNGEYRQCIDAITNFSTSFFG